MCGIAGFVGNGCDDDLTAMNEVLLHRGPDAEGTWCDREKLVYLAHKRLAIIDIQDGAQPMQTSKGDIAVVYNGEIYNHAELRRQLEDAGHHFQTDHSDTEVLLHGYQQWREDLPGHLNGMWAFAIYDGPRGVLFMSRDRFGEKPLFYSSQNGSFVFASELSSLSRHGAIRSSISDLSLKKYFAYGFIPAPRSIYERIYKLPAGHNLVLDVNDLSYVVHEYWDFVLEPFERIPENPTKEWGDELRSLLGQAIRRRLMSDVPLGVLLSGGLDSACVVALAQSSGRREPIKTFSMGFDEVDFDELSHAQLVASHFRTEHHARKLTALEALPLIPEVTSRLDEPLGDSSLIPTYLLCKTAREHITVALGGDGSDELFAGYDPFRILRLADLYARIVPRPLHRAIRTVAAMIPSSHGYMCFSFRLTRLLRGLSYSSRLWNPVWLGPLEPSEIQECFDEPSDIEEVYSEAIQHWDGCREHDVIDRTMLFYIKLYLQDDILVKVDRASMMNSLEVRSPFLDIDLVDFVRRIPTQYKIRRGRVKFLLKKAMESMVPRRIIDRPKHGFAIPIGRWLKNGMLNIDEERRTAGQKLPFILKQIDDHRHGRNDNRMFLWNQLALAQSLFQ